MPINAGKPGWMTADEILMGSDAVDRLMWENDANNVGRPYPGMSQAKREGLLSQYRQDPANGMYMSTVDESVFEDNSWQDNLVMAAVMAGVGGGVGAWAGGAGAAGGAGGMTLGDSSLGALADVGGGAAGAGAVGTGGQMFGESGLLTGEVGGTAAGGVGAANYGGAASIAAGSAAADSVAAKVAQEAAKSALSRFINGTATADDWLKIAGTLGSTALGLYGANQQAGAQSDLASKYWGAGAPSRARFEASMTPGFDPMSIPGYSGALDTASKQQLSALSATGGNPFGNPGGLIDAQKRVVAGTALPAIDAYQRLNQAGGQLGFTQAANFDQGAATGNSNIYNALGYGLNALTSPQQDNSLAGTLRQLADMGYLKRPE